MQHHSSGLSLCAKQFFTSPSSHAVCPKFAAMDRGVCGAERAAQAQSRRTGALRLYYSPCVEIPRCPGRTSGADSRCWTGDVKCLAHRASRGGDVASAHAGTCTNSLATRCCNTCAGHTVCGQVVPPAQHAVVSIWPLPAAWKFINQVLLSSSAGITAYRRFPWPTIRKCNEDPRDKIAHTSRMSRDEG